MPKSMSSIINYDETVITLIKLMTVIDVMAQESVIDVVAVISYHIGIMGIFQYLITTNNI